VVLDDEPPEELLEEELLPQPARSAASSSARIRARAGIGLERYWVVACAALCLALPSR
jgi:hypothetical protein